MHRCQAPQVVYKTREDDLFSSSYIIRPIFSVQYQVYILQWIILFFILMKNQCMPLYHDIYIGLTSGDNSIQIRILDYVVKYCSVSCL